MKILSKKFKELPESGEALKKPYTAHWYPYRHNGTARIFQSNSPSALQKYDQAFPSSDGSTRSRLGNYVITAARGAIGPGTAMVLPPHHNVILNRSLKSLEMVCVSVPQISRSLLTEVHLHVHTRILGGRRCRNVVIENAISSGWQYRLPRRFPQDCVWQWQNQMYQEPTLPRSLNRTSVLAKMSNAGTFHLAIANWIGLREQTIVFDKEAYNQVWNYPTVQLSP